jgi:hypothetical protein
MEIETVTITGNESNIRQAQSIAETHELVARSTFIEPGKYQLTVEKNEPEQKISHYLFSLDFNLDTRPIQQIRGMSVDKK